MQIRFFRDFVALTKPTVVFFAFIFSHFVSVALFTVSSYGFPSDAFLPTYNELKFRFNNIFNMMFCAASILMFAKIKLPMRF